MNAKQLKFVEEYLVDLNAAGAAIRAGYSRNGAKATAHKLIKKYKGMIDEELAERSKRTEINADRVVRELSKVAFLDKDKCRDKLKALELLGRHLGMFNDKLQVDMRLTPAMIMDKVRERLNG